MTLMLKDLLSTKSSHPRFMEEKSLQEQIVTVKLLPQMSLLIVYVRN